MQMYDSNQLLSSLVQLGSWFLEEAANDQNALALAQAQNGWFTPESVQLAFQSHGHSLSSEGVEAWGGGYNLTEEASGLTVGLILAGNLPLVGWHDILCSVLAGHEVHVKLSSDDAVLPRMVVAKWAEFAPYVAQAVTFHDGLMPQVDAVVCPGGRMRVVISGRTLATCLMCFAAHEPPLQCWTVRKPKQSSTPWGRHLCALWHGLSKRDQSWLPEGFDLDRCFAQWVRWGHLGQHGKYANNYDYHKAVWLLNKEDMIENGFLLVKEDTGLVSPIGTLFVERYSDEEAVAKLGSGRRRTASSDREAGSELQPSR